MCHAYIPEAGPAAANRSAVLFMMMIQGTMQARIAS